MRRTMPDGARHEYDAADRMVAVKAYGPSVWSRLSSRSLTSDHDTGRLRWRLHL